MSAAEVRADGPEVIPLALLDGYKVRWSRETVARDIVQNFFDEVDDFGEVVIESDPAKGVVEVRGPSRFDLEYLRYIGATTKASRRAAGGFGEGFKVCALVLVRDFHCAVTAGSGPWEIRPFLQPMKLGRELCYEVRRRPGADEHPGSFVRLEGVDRRLCEVFAGAKQFFRHPDNPRLASPIHVDEAAGVGVYEAQDDHMGDLYYRRQHRGRVRFGLGGALTFAFDDRLAAHEGDRDRRDLAAAWPLIKAVAAGLPDAVLGDLVNRLRAYWHRGGKVLGALLSEAARRGLRLSFPRRWLARVRRGYFLEQHATRIGFHLGVQALGAVGMPSVEERFGAAQTPRNLTLLEAARMVITRDLYVLLTREEPLFKHIRAVDVEQRGADFRAASCVVPGQSLAAPFGEGIATCLARLACGNGLRSRRNADRLTALLEGAMLRAGTLQPFADRWAAAADDPTREAVDPELLACPDDPAGDHRRPRVSFCVLAPQGFPPAEALTARIHALAAKQHAVAYAVAGPVDGTRSAFEHYARGVPSVWIGGLEIEPPRRQRPSFAVRTFAAPGGARALLPDDDVLAAAIRAEARPLGARAGRPFLRKALGGAALDRWLALNAPAEHRARMRSRAIEVASNEAWTQRLPLPVHALARRLAARYLPSLLEGDDGEDLDGDAHEAIAGGYARIAALLTAVEASAPGATLAAPPSEAAIEALLQRADAELADADADEGAVFARIVAAAPAALEIGRWLDVAPLDAVCAGACVTEAHARLWDVSPSGGPEALAEARERFDAAVVISIARHDERDADGNPPPCFLARTVLAAHYGRPSPHPLPPDGTTPVAIAVRAAWEEAIGAGLDEIEATRRCLAAAEKAGGV